MLTAAEAKAQTDLIRENAFRLELKKIEDLITKEIKAQNYFIVVDSLSKQTQKHLEENGYIVTYGSQYDESYYQISWSS